jgi:hypothetical protein
MQLDENLEWIVTNKSSLCVGTAAAGDFELLQVSISDLESMQDAKMETAINGQRLLLLFFYLTWLGSVPVRCYGIIKLLY